MRSSSNITKPDEALQQLIEGNNRYAATKSIHPNQSTHRRHEVARGQKPWAAILGCIDSRVSPEILFDQGLGDLLVIRTAGQVIDEAVLASLEFSVEEGVKLVMVLGHNSCGAIKGTITALRTTGHAEGHIDWLVQSIKPAIEIARTQPGDLLENAVRANVHLKIEILKSSEIVARAIKNGSIVLVGAQYDLYTGLIKMIS